MIEREGVSQYVYVCESFTSECESKGMCVSVCVWVCVCGCERERERECGGHESQRRRCSFPPNHWSSIKT